MRDSTIFYASFYEAIDDLPPQNQLEVYKAIFELSLKGNEIELTGLSKTIFTLIRPQILANLARYENGKKGAEYGKKGGRPLKEKPLNNPKITPNQTPNKNNNVNVNVNNNNNNNNNVKENNKPIGFNFDGFDDNEIESIKLFLQYKKEKKNSYTATGLIGLRTKLLELKKEHNLIDCINSSMANNYQGVFPPKQDGRYKKHQSAQDALHRCNSQDFSGEF